MLKQCVILIAERETRPGLPTGDVPASLLPVGGRAFVDYVVDEVTRRGIEEIVCIAGSQSVGVQEWVLRTQKRGIDVRCVVEAEPRGSAGALLGARDFLDEEFLLLNGSSIFDINLLDLAAWQPSGSWVGIVALRSTRDAGERDAVTFTNDAMIAFAETADAGGRRSADGGVYRLKKQVLDYIEAMPCSVERDVLPLLTSRGLLRGRPYDGFFLDLRIAGAYEAAQSLVPAIARRPALFLDRDGVVNKDVGYAYRPDQIEWVDGVFDAVKAANDAGAYTFIVTNQSGVARGLYGEADVIRLHGWMKREFLARGASIDDFAYCPHHPTMGNGAYTRACDCRKPAPGLLLDLAGRRPVDLRHSLLVGDKDIDMQAAGRAGVGGILYHGGSVRQLIDAWVAGCRAVRAGQLGQVGQTGQGAGQGAVPRRPDRRELS